MNLFIIVSYLYCLCLSYDLVNVCVLFYCVCIFWFVLIVLMCLWFFSVVILLLLNVMLYCVSYLYSMFFVYRGWGIYEKFLMMLYLCLILLFWFLVCCFILGYCLLVCCWCKCLFCLRIVDLEMEYVCGDLVVCGIFFVGDLLFC